MNIVDICRALRDVEDELLRIDAGLVGLRFEEESKYLTETGEQFLDCWNRKKALLKTLTETPLTSTADAAIVARLALSLLREDEHQPPAVELLSHIARYVGRCAA